MSEHPYRDLPPAAYWKQGVADANPLHLEGMYTPRFAIGAEDRIAAAGSCFAQHIGRQFKLRGYRFVDVEPPPPMLPAADHHRFGYDLYSARYGNLYSARQLVQLLKRAGGELTPVDDAWQDEAGWWDPLRPAMEPAGFTSYDELATVRAAHLAAVATILEQTDVFVFTFGLTEAWRHREDGVVYPTCPGTVRGTFDPALHEFVNFSWPDVMGDFEEFLAVARAVNPAMRFLVTVSPVPLTATASGQHVLAATMASKSILRAVCAELVARYDCVDYYPSYELVASHPMRAMFFDPNLRTVAAKGVAHVMDTFFAAHGDGSRQARHAGAVVEPVETPDDVVCDEAILATFG